MKVAYQKIWLGNFFDYIYVFHIKEFFLRFPVYLYDNKKANMKILKNKSNYYVH